MTEQMIEKIRLVWSPSTSMYHWEKSWSECSVGFETREEAEDYKNNTEEIAWQDSTWIKRMPADIALQDIIP